MGKGYRMTTRTTPEPHPARGPARRDDPAAPFAAGAILQPMTDQTLPPILVLGRDTCDDTTRSRALLTGRRIAFTYRKVDEDAAADAWIRRLNDGNWRTPTILIGNPEAPDVILREPSDEELLVALGLR